MVGFISGEIPARLRPDECTSFFQCQLGGSLLHIQGDDPKGSWLDAADFLSCTFPLPFMNVPQMGSFNKHRILRQQISISFVRDPNVVVLKEDQQVNGHLYCGSPRKNT